MTKTLYEKVSELLEPTRLCFQNICQKHLLFHLGFFAIIGIEACLLGLFFPLLVDAFFLGLGIAIIFFTTLLYFILRIYYNDRKPEEFHELHDEFLRECRSSLPPELTPEEISRALSDCAYFMAENFQKSSFETIKLPHFLSWAQPYANRILNRILVADIEQITSLFLFSSIGEEIKIVQLDPTKIDTHGRLASLFIALSDLYTTESIRGKKALLNAVEELNIILHLMPKNIAALETLAKCFSKLHLGDQELLQYEVLNQLKPHDPTILFELGKLYLERNQSGKGLEIYGELKKRDESKAAELIRFYGKDVKLELGPK